MIVAITYQEDTGEPLASMRVPLTVASIRKAMPAARIVHMANETFPGVPGVDEVFRYPRAGRDLIDWAYEALATLCERADEDVLKIGTDVLLMRDVVRAFGDFDIAACRYPTRTRQDGAFCDEIVFVRPAGARFLREVLAIYQAPDFAHRNGWEGGQTAFLAASRTTSCRLSSLDFDTYGFTPEVEGEDNVDAAIVHFRGPRKRWMMNYAAAKGIRL